MLNRAIGSILSGQMNLGHQRNISVTTDRNDYFLEYFAQDFKACINNLHAPKLNDRLVPMFSRGLVQNPLVV